MAMVISRQKTALQAELTLPKCSSATSLKCSYIRKIANGQASDDLSTLVLRTELAVRRIGKELDSNLPLTAKECQNASDKLRERQIKQVWIVTGWCFFFLIIPALLAYQAMQNNAQLAIQIANLNKLAEDLKKHNPAQRLISLNQDLKKAREDLVSLQSALAGDLSSEEAFKKVCELSAVEYKIQEIQLHIDSLVEHHASLAEKVPAHALPSMPAEPLAKIQDEVKETALEVRDEIAKETLKLGGLSVGEALTLSDERATEASQDVSPNAVSLFPRPETGDNSAHAEALALRDLMIGEAREKIRELASLGVPTGKNTGIINGGNSCYMASVIQSMRWSPVRRYLVERDLPAKELFGYSSSGEPITYNDSLEWRAFREGVQERLRAFFTALDSGLGIAPKEINEFREYIGGFDNRWNERENGHYQQKDAEEFLCFLDNLLLKSTVQSPYNASDCFNSGLHESYSKEYRCVPNEELLLPSLEARDSYLISAQPEDMSTHAISLPFIIESNRLRVDSKNLSMANLIKSMGCGVESDPAEYFRVGLENEASELQELRQRLKGPAEEVDPGVRELLGLSPLKGVLVEKSPGEFYAAGDLQISLKPLNNPPSLTFQLKRFHVNPLTGEAYRIGGAVPLPNEFARVDVSDPTGQQKLTYELSSCVCHIGNTPVGGHYIAYNKIGGRWYCFNDGHVQLDKNFDPAKNENVYMATYEQIVAR